MIKAAVLTATRAEYGLMRQLIFRMRDDSEIELNLLVTGTHLSEAFGMTVKEIVQDNVPIAARIRILSEQNGIVDVGKTMGNALTKFSEFFEENKYDFLLVDGDRYETLMICIAAVSKNIPIVHCGGGEVTEGANDDYWRHAITKLSCLHFPTMNIYRERIIHMGENPQRVVMVGSLGLDNVCTMSFADRYQLEERVGMQLDKPYALVTFHPVTLENETTKSQIEELLKACDRVTDMKFIFTKANADENGHIVNRLLEEYVTKHCQTAVLIASLGSYYYLSAMKYCEFVLGNSSSGLIEAPSFKIPTINIGNRQKGRERAKSIIDCEPVADSIYDAILKARCCEFKSICKSVINPNGDGKASERIIASIKKNYQLGIFSMKKQFFAME